MDSISYFLDSPHILLDCGEEEKYMQLFYSIKTLREYCQIPVTIYTNSKIPLDKVYCCNKKYNINDCFSGITIIQTSEIISNTIPINSVFLNYPKQLDRNIHEPEIIHKMNGCEIKSDFVVYDPNRTEFWVPSQYWSCSVRDRIKNSKYDFCNYCCRLIS